MAIKGSKYALAVVTMYRRKHVVEILSLPNSEGELSCVTGGRIYSIHGSKLRPITQKARAILRPFAASTATNTYPTES